METDEHIKSLIRRRRKQLLVHRVLYYVYNTNLITDQQYDEWNRQLNELEDQYPYLAEQVEYHECSPNRTVGSDNINDYDFNIVRIAQQLITHKIEK